MSTRQQVAAFGQFPIELWDDMPAREPGCWGTLRSKCAAVAATREGWTLGEEIGRTILFMRIVDGADGELMEVETTHDQAEFVNLRLAMWAVAP